MHYEINVSKDGKHFFATHERSATTSFEAHRLIETFASKFPVSEGYEISCTFYPGSGYSVAITGKHASAHIDIGESISQLVNTAFRT